MRIPEPEPLPAESPSQDYSNHYADDRLLRKHGFKIWKWRKGREAVWERAAEKYTQSAALATIRSEDK